MKMYEDAASRLHVDEQLSLAKVEVAKVVDKVIKEQEVVEHVLREDKGRRAGASSHQAHGAPGWS